MALASPVGHRMPRRTVSPSGSTRRSRSPAATASNRSPARARRKASPRTSSPRDHGHTGRRKDAPRRDRSAPRSGRRLSFLPPSQRGPITADGRWFKDAHGRVVTFHGINVSGNGKLPTRPEGATHRKDLDEFFNHRDISFVGRPFPLDEAEEHFTRLRACGFNLIRLVVSWEALEHGGPGVYDEEFIDYLVEIVRIAGEFGLFCFVDPHQDVWSRFSGGSGAPGWTFDVVGMDITKFEATGAALTEQEYPGELPAMIWSSNHIKLASATMFALFFGGRKVAPHMKVDGENIQDYLQRHHCNAYAHLAKRLDKLPNCIGFETMNEPNGGLLETKSKKDLTENNSLLRFGDTPTPEQSFYLGSGHPQWVEVYTRGLAGVRRSGMKLLNPDGVSLWKKGPANPRGECVWKQHGVWGQDGGGRPVLLKPDHFNLPTGARDFQQHFLLPYINRFADTVRGESARMMIFAQTSVLHDPPQWGPGDVTDNVVHTPHWYEPLTLALKTYFPWFCIDVYSVMAKRRNWLTALAFGTDAVARSHARQLRHLREAGLKYVGETPCVVGEIGIPMDMVRSSSFTSSVFNTQVDAMQATLRAAEVNLMNYTVWNYTPTNTNSHGDQWNGEDLSVFSYDQQTDPKDPLSGVRAVEAVVRPNAVCIAGEPLFSEFDLRSGIFEVEFDHQHDHASGKERTTEVFVPAIHYGKDPVVDTSGGTVVFCPEEQMIYFECEAGRGRKFIRIAPDPEHDTLQRARLRRRQLLSRMLSIGVLVMVFTALVSYLSVRSA